MQFSWIPGVLSLFDGRERGRLAGLLFMMLVGAGLDILGFGMVFPLIALLVDPVIVQRESWLSVMDYLAGGSPERLAFMALVGMFLLFALKNAYLSLYTLIETRFAYAKQVQIARRILAAYLSQPYQFFRNHNSARLIQNLTTEVTSVVAHVVMPLFAIAAETIFMAAVLALLVLLRSWLVLSVFGMVAVFGAVTYAASHKYLASLGRRRQRFESARNRALREAFGGIKEILVRGCEMHFQKRIDENSIAFASAQQRFHALTYLPRFWIETFAVLGLTLLVAMMVYRNEPPQAILASVGTVAAFGFRIIIGANRVLISISAVRFGLPALASVQSALALSAAGESVDQPASAIAVEAFRDKIEFEGVSYSYPANAVRVLDGVSLTVAKGEFIGVIGISGAGKTTLVDLLLGLIEPTSGTIAVDGRPLRYSKRQWMRQIAYIPQEVFLLDDSIRRNVAFGVPDREIDDRKVWAAIERAQLDGYVKGLDEGVDTVIGENGARCSGGQRQRIGIARALYREASVLVLDEATSALDSATESKLMQEVLSLRPAVTIVAVTHRLNCLKGCDRIVRLEHGRLLPATLPPMSSSPGVRG